MADIRQDGVNWKNNYPQKRIAHGKWAISLYALFKKIFLYTVSL